MPVSARATRSAEQAAARAHVFVRSLDTLSSARAAAHLLRAVWGSAGSTPPMGVELLRAIEHAGGYVMGAYDGEDLLGASIAFLGGGATLHSHISGVLARARGREVGFALKLHQRAWGLERGLTAITWTFDPLVRRNAWFNLSKLAAVASEYLPDFYGPMNDAINANDSSDRLLVTWPVAGASVAAAADGRAVPPDEGDLRRAGAVVTLDGDERGPVRVDAVCPPDRPMLVRVPGDIERLRRDGSAAIAGRWRAAVRDALAPPIDAGWRAVGLTRSGCYLLLSPQRLAAEARQAPVNRKPI